MHVCTWKRCGAPATKKIRIRLRHPERYMDTEGNPIPDAGEGKDLWRCDPHYEMALDDLGDGGGVFIVEY
jgi:hypothetical protein